MGEEPKLPPLLAEQIDKLFSILKSMPELLQTGRAYGLVVGLSPVLGGEMVRRHGEAAAPVLANVWRVDPSSHINSFLVQSIGPAS
jgi:hypothetical protein